MATGYYTSQYFTTTLAVVGGITDAQTTGIILQSVTGIQSTAKPGIALLSYADPLNETNAEWVKFNSINSTTKELVGVTRGAEKGSAKAHSNGVTVAFPISESHINPLVDAVSIEGVATNILQGVLDEDNMASNSATKAVTQQSIKAYVDSDGGSLGGWTASTDTWVYASASTFTIAGVDRTTTFTPGTRLKFTQTTAKYAVVVSSAFSTDTTVTIAVNTDYTIANAAITLPYYSYQASPQGYPSWFAFTPAWDNITEGSGTNVGAFSLTGKTVNFRASIVLAADTSVSGSVVLTLPVTINAGYNANTIIGTVGILDANVGLIGGLILPTGYIGSYVASTANLTVSSLSSTVPMTWTTTDVLTVTGTYQAA